MSDDTHNKSPAIRTAAKPNQTMVRKDLRKVDINLKNYYLGAVWGETTDRFLPCE
jgi:hypothetical protein